MQTVTPATKAAVSTSVEVRRRRPDRAAVTRGRATTLRPTPGAEQGAGEGFNFGGSQDAEEPAEDDQSEPQGGSGGFNFGN